MKETDRKKGNEAIAHRWVLVTFHWLHLLRLCGLLFAGRFLITVSISLLVMGLLRSSISSWFSFGKLYFSNNLSISSKLSILLA